MNGDSKGRRKRYPAAFRERNGEKDMGELNPMYKRENLRLLRRALRLTQKEFIDRFLSDEEGKPTMSIATLSNLEAKDGPRMNDVIISVSEQLGIGFFCNGWRWRDAKLYRPCIRCKGNSG